MRGKKVHTLSMAVCVLYLSLGLLHNLDIWVTLQFGPEGSVAKLLSNLTNSPGLPITATWTGSHGGYGFYGPQVGSRYIVQYSWTDGDRSHTYDHHPLLRSRSASLRYASYLDVQEAWLPHEEGPTDTTLARATLISLTRHLAREFGLSNICTHVSVQDSRQNHYRLHTYHYEKPAED